MNIHEHQAKGILKKFGASVPEGVYALTVEDLLEKVKKLNTSKYVLKAQIHAGGRGRGSFRESRLEGGVHLVDSAADVSS